MAAQMVIVTNKSDPPVAYGPFGESELAEFCSKLKPADNEKVWIVPITPVHATWNR